MTKEYIDMVLKKVTSEKEKDVIGQGTSTGNPVADTWAIIMTGLFGSCYDDPNPWWHNNDSDYNPPPQTGYGCTAH